MILTKTFSGTKASCLGVAGKNGEAEVWTSMIHCFSNNLEHSIGGDLFMKDLHWIYIIYELVLSNLQEEMKTVKEIDEATLYSSIDNASDGDDDYVDDEYGDITMEEVRKSNFRI